MRKIIDGKAYDTETAQLVCHISPVGFSSSDFRYEDSTLYKSPKGTFFIAGEGGPLTRWAQPMGSNGRSGGSGLQVVSDDEARALCERHGSAADYTAAFGSPEEG